MLRLNDPLEKLASEYHQLRDEFQSMIKTKPTIIEPQAKSAFEYRYMQVQFRLQKVYRLLSKNTIEQNCRTCNNPEEITIENLERIFTSKGLQYQCSVCALAEIEAKQ